MAEDKAWKIIFMAAFLILLLYAADKLNSNTYQKNQNYLKDYNQTMTWLKENLDESSIVLSDWKYGPNIAALAGKGTVTTTKVYPSERKFIAERYRDASRFFFSVRENDAMKVVEKYNITHIFIAKNDFQYDMCFYIDICDRQNVSQFARFVKSNSSSMREKFILTRMVDGRLFYNFKKVYNSYSFVVYQVVKPEDTQYASTLSQKGITENSLKNSQAYEKYSDVYGMIVPHHLAYAYQIIADTFKSIKGSCDTIIILGPDHYDASEYKISTSNSNWKTAFGNLIPDEEAIKDLGLEVDEPVHVHEHSVRTIMPFIKYKFPDAKIVPILLKGNLKEQEAIDLGKKISKLDNTLVIASVDFSHNTELSTAIQHDLSSIKSIRNFEEDKIYSLDTDSRPSIKTLLTTMEFKGAKKAELLNYTNCGQLTNKYPKKVGYVSMIFQK